MSSAFLHSEGFIWEPMKPESTWPLGLKVQNHLNTVWRNNGALAASPNGDFHPVWIEVGNGEGQLRTATVTAGPVHSTLPRVAFDEGKACDVTQQIAILYGGDQNYDVSTSLLSVRITLKNKSSQPLQAPILLKAETLTSKVFNLEIANSDNGLSGPGAMWDLTPATPDGNLNAGAMSKSYPLEFHATPIEGILNEELLSMKLKAYACIPH